MSSYINVTDAPYNAVLDGVTDDTSAINSALSAATGVVYIPEGTALISAPLQVPSNVHLIGNGVGSTIIQSPSNPGYPAIEFPNGASDDASVSCLTVDGGSSAPGTRTGCGIFAKDGTNRIKIFNCEVRNCADNGIESDGVDTDIYFNWVHDNYANGIYVIGVSSPAVVRAERIWIHHNRCKNNSKGTTTWDGIDIDPISANCTVESNVVIGNDIIVFESGANVSNSYGHKVINNHISLSTENGINFLGTLLDIEASNNYIEQPTGSGIIFNGFVARFKAKDNRIIGPTQHGIYIRNDHQFTTTNPNGGEILGNHIENPGTGVSNTCNGIHIEHSATDVLVSANKVLDTQSPKTMKYAIETSAAGTDLVVFGNKTKTGLTGNLHTKVGQQVANNY